MPYTSEFLQIEGRVIKLVVGLHAEGRLGINSTVNVFDDSDTEGNYEEAYRFAAMPRLTSSYLAKMAKTLELVMN